MMQTLALFIAFFGPSSIVLAQSFDSRPSIAGLTIPNSHTVDATGSVVRGKQPTVSRVAELQNLGIQQVLILKPINKEVSKEVEALNRLGISNRVIPIDWTNSNLTQTCLEVVDAVNSIRKFKQNGQKVYFHCSAGEDRTGMVAGLFRMLDQKWSRTRAFEEEMCRRGFANGNPNKPNEVVNLIERNLTPIFVGLSQTIEKSGSLDSRACTFLGQTQVGESVPTCR